MASEKVIAKPSGAGCLKGNIHTGEPRGTTTTVARIETYIAEPSPDIANGNIVLYFPDVFGLFINARLIMDEFAAAGYLALGLDYFQGDAIGKYRKGKESVPGFNFDEWKDKHMPFSIENAPKWAQEVKEKYGKAGTKFACVGYCWGAPYVCEQLSEKGICSVGAFAHPAFLKESHFYELKSPLFLSCSEVDHTFGNDFRKRAVDIMQEKSKVFQVQLFQGVAHGFALRGDMSVPYEIYTKEASLQGIIGWFDFWLSQK